MTIHSQALKLGKRCKHVKNHNIFLFLKLHTFIVNNKLKYIIEYLLF